MATIVTSQNRLVPNLMFSTEAQYVVMKRRIWLRGLWQPAPDGNIKFNCKAVVIACGGFGRQPQKMHDRS